MTARSTLSYRCEKWSLCSEDLRRVQICGHRCLPSISHEVKSTDKVRQRLTNDEVQHCIFEDHKLSRLDRIIFGSRLSWLEHVHRVKSRRIAKSIFIQRTNSRMETIMWWSSNFMALWDEIISKSVGYRWFLSLT